MKYLKHLFLLLLLLVGVLVKAQQPLSNVKEQSPSLAILATNQKLQTRRFWMQGPVKNLHRTTYRGDQY